MIKALLRKEFSQIKKMYLTNKRRKREGGRGMFIFLIVIYFILMMSMGALDSLFAVTLIPIGEGWLYYFFISILAFLIGILGSVFTTAEMLFRAKDNEFLMSMPIPPANIIFTRMTGVYIMGLIYELLVMLPGVILGFIFGGITVLKLLFAILGIILLGFVILTFSCFFGWIIAIVMAKLRNKNILTVIISVVFIGLFVYLRFRADAFFRMVVENAEDIGEWVQGTWYPVYSLGLGMNGDVIGMLVFAAITGVLFGVTYWLISRSFNRIVNIKPSETKAAFREGQIRTSSADRALLAKELRRFSSSPNYMLNCGLGILFLVAAMVIVPIMSGQIREMIVQIEKSMPFGSALVFVILAFAVCILTGFIDISAPSISLEGPYIWVLQSMPITAGQVLMAKFKMAAIITGIPTVICMVVVEAVLGARISVIILSALLAAVYVVFTVLIGLRLDLGRPYMDWTNEMQPVKQNMSVLFTMLIGMFCPIVPGGLYLLAGMFVGPEVYLAIWIVVFAALSFILFSWFKKNGAARFVLLGQ